MESSLSHSHCYAKHWPTFWPQAFFRTVYSVTLLGGCRTLWDEREQTACIFATEERMRYQKSLNVSEVTIVVGSLWWHIVSTSLAGSIAQIIMSA